MNIGLILKRVFYLFIEDNYFYFCVVGVVLRFGNLVSDYVVLKFGGVYSREDIGMRVGGIVMMRSNVFI